MFRFAIAALVMIGMSHKALNENAVAAIKRVQAVSFPFLKQVRHQTMNMALVRV